MRHTRLIIFLSQAYGIAGETLHWIGSYLRYYRQQPVTINKADSSKMLLEYGVLQGLVLKPKLFKDYVAPLARLIYSYGVKFHGYVDDV